MPKFYSIIRILFTRSTGTFSRVVLNFLNGFLREIKFEFEQISLYFMKFVVCVANLFLWVDLFFILQKHKICIDAKCIDGVFCHFWGRTTFILELTMLVGWVFSLVSLKFLKLDFQTSRVYSTDLWKLRQVSRNSTTMSESSARALSIRQFFIVLNFLKLFSPDHGPSLNFQVQENDRATFRWPVQWNLQSCWYGHFYFIIFYFQFFQVECVRQMHNNESFREAAEESSRDFCQLIEGWVRARSYSSYAPTWAKSNSTRRWERKRARPLFFSQKGALFFCGSSFEKSDFNTLSNFRFELVQSCSNMVKIY